MLGEQEIRKVALLARLELTDAEVVAFGSQLSELLDYVAILNEVDTEGVEPMAHAVEQTNVFRDDAPRPPLLREDALANAPKTDGKFFRVPAILDAP